MKKQREIQAVVSKVSFQQAKIDEDNFWRNTSPAFRLQELKRLRERYMKFLNINPDARIEEVVTRKLMGRDYV